MGKYDVENISAHLYRRAPVGEHERSITGSSGVKGDVRLSPRVNYKIQTGCYQGFWPSESLSLLSSKPASPGHVCGCCPGRDSVRSGSGTCKRPRTASESFPLRIP